MAQVHGAAVRVVAARGEPGSQRGASRVGRVDVAAEDLGGRTRQTSATLIRHGAPPALTPEKADLWKK